MDIPKTAQEFAIWVGMQFPVLGAAALIAWLVNRWNEKHRLEVLRELKQAYQDVKVEKDARIVERDGRITELKAEVEGLKSKRSRRPKPDKGGEGGSKP